MRRRRRATPERQATATCAASALDCAVGRHPQPLRDLALWPRTLTRDLGHRPDSSKRVGEEDLVRSTELGQAEVADRDTQVERLRQVQHLLAHDACNTAVTNLGRVQ